MTGNRAEDRIRTRNQIDRERALLPRGKCVRERHVDSGPFDLEAVLQRAVVGHEKGDRASGKLGGHIDRVFGQADLDDLARRGGAIGGQQLDGAEMVGEGNRDGGKRSGPL